MPVLLLAVFSFSAAADLTASGPTKCPLLFNTIERQAVISNHGLVYEAGTCHVLCTSNNPSNVINTKQRRIIVVHFPTSRRNEHRLCCLKSTAIFLFAVTISRSIFSAVKWRGESEGKQNKKGWWVKRLCVSLSRLSICWFFSAGNYYLKKE